MTECVCMSEEEARVFAEYRYFAPKGSPMELLSIAIISSNAKFGHLRPLANFLVYVDLFGVADNAIIYAHAVSAVDDARPYETKVKVFFNGEKVAWEGEEDDSDTR